MTGPGPTGPSGGGPADRAGPPDVGVRGEPDPEAVSRFVEAFASQLVAGGMARMPARVFSALLASEDGVLTSAELGDRLKVSPAAVSGAVRYLADMVMITREREPGSRRERYRVHSDQWYEMLADREGLLRQWERTMRDGIAALGPDSRPGRRVAETLEFFTFVQTEFTAAMDRWRTYRATGEGPFGADRDGDGAQVPDPGPQR